MIDRVDTRRSRLLRGCTARLVSASDAPSNVAWRGSSGDARAIRSPRDRARVRAAEAHDANAASARRRRDGHDGVGRWKTPSTSSQRETAAGNAPAVRQEISALLS